MDEKKEFVKACELYHKVTDGTHDSPKYVTAGLPLVTSKNIKGGVLDMSSANLISEEDYIKINERSKVEQWDVIISMIGEYCGYTYIEKSENIKYCIKNVGLFKTGSETEANWLSYYLKSDYGRYYIAQSKSGSSQPYLALGSLRSLPIWNPPVVKKRNIVKVLKCLDDKIELNNKINIELEQMAKALYDYWFVQFDFPNEEGVPYKSSGGEMVYDKVLKREIPEGWKVKSLFKSFDVQYGFPFSTENFSDNESGKPVIRIRDILQNTISTYSSQENIDEKYKLLEGDLLVGMDGNFHLNFWSKTNCYLNQRVVRIREKDKLLSNFIALFQIEPFIKLREKSVSRTTVGHLSDKDLKSINILLPSEDLRIKCKIFDEFLLKIISNKKQNQQLASLRDWLLPMLMNGQVRVGESDGEILGLVAESDAEYQKT